MSEHRLEELQDLLDEFEKTETSDYILPPLMILDILKEIEGLGQEDSDMYGDWEVLLVFQYLKLERQGDGMPKIYVISNRYGDLKIGVTSGNIKTRLSGLQTGSSVKLEIVIGYYVDDAYKLEKFLHSKFKDNRMEGEWFKSCIKDDLLEYLDSLGLEVASDTYKLF